MQDGDEADLGAEVFGVARNGTKRFGSCAKQDVVHHGLVLIRDRRNLLWHREDNMEILDRQQFSLAVLKPLSA